MKTFLMLTMGAVLVSGCASAVGTATPDAALSAAEREAGWRMLWDGKTFDGWRSFRYDAAPTNGWSIQDGVLTLSRDSKAGDLITREVFGDFELELEFKISPAGNSGIKYFVADLKRGNALGPEFQILDDDRHPDAKLGRDGNRKTGSLYDVIPAPADKVLKPVGEWNTARIVSRGSVVEHWLNGVMTVRYDRASPEFAAQVAKSKFAKEKTFAQAEKGHILLQDHIDPVSYRAIRIRVPVQK